MVPRNYHYRTLFIFEMLMKRNATSISSVRDQYQSFVQNIYILCAERSGDDAYTNPKCIQHKL